MSIKTVDLEVEVKHETDSAMLIICENKEVWIPKSQISEEDKLTASEYPSGRNVDLRIITIPEWLAYEKELI